MDLENIFSDSVPPVKDDESISKKEKPKKKPKLTPQKRKRTSESTSRSPKRVKVDKRNRTFRVSNLPFSEDLSNLKKYKKDLQKLFCKYGTIESIRFRDLPLLKNSRLPKRVLVNTKKFDFSKKVTITAFIVYKSKLKITDKIHYCGHNLLVKRMSEAKQNVNAKTRIFVGNVPFDINYNEVLNIFDKKKQFLRGNVLEDVILLKNSKGSNNGCMILTFENEVDLSKFMRLNVNLRGCHFRFKKFVEGGKTQELSEMSNVRKDKNEWWRGMKSVNKRKKSVNKRKKRKRKHR